MEVLNEMASDHESKRQRYNGEDAELLKKVASQDITEVTLRENLAQYVEQVNSQALFQQTMLYNLG